MEEQIDYYFNEEGLMVFTAAYHLKRGYCCKNKCKHCPWNYGRKTNEQARLPDGQGAKNKEEGMKNK